MEKNMKIAAIVAVVVVGLLVAGSMAGWLNGGTNTGSKPTLTQTGSSTVLPLAIAWADEFDGADISVSGGGSSHGINSLLLGEADLGDASRLMKGSDYEKVGGDPSLVNPDGTASGPAPSGVMPVKWVVAYDVLTVVVNNDNDWASALNYSQLYKIFTDDDPAVYWDEVPGLENAPHMKIEIYAPDEASGTYDYFFEEIIPHWGQDDQQANPRLEAADGIYHPSADDNVILSAIRDNKYAIGYFGFAYYKENPGMVKAVAIAEEEEAPVVPSLEAVSDYPMSRPLHIYTDSVPEQGTVINDYLQFVLGTEGQTLVTLVGYVPLDQVDPDLLAEQLTELGA